MSKTIIILLAGVLLTGCSNLTVTFYNRGGTINTPFSQDSEDCDTLGEAAAEGGGEFSPNIPLSAVKQPTKPQQYSSHNPNYKVGPSR